MTPSEFVAEALTFEPGKIYVVSGPSYDVVYSLLQDAAAAIEGSTPNMALVYDAKEKITYAARGFSVNTQQARLFEYVKLAIENSFVALIANEFDREDPIQNPTPISILVDTVMDVFSPTNVSRIQGGTSCIFTSVRELWPFVDRMYHYDTRTGRITYVKDQVPVRPP